jgi:type IV pilus assembly protein PilV
MRANISRLQMPEAENPYLQVDFQSGQALPSSQFDCYGNVDCDPSQMAQADIADWLMRLDRSLPGVRVRICRDAVRGAGEEPNWACEAASTAAPVVIKIGWGDKEQSADENRNAMPRLNLLITSFPA